MSGQMKTLLDRFNPLFQSDYSFREVYLITAAGDDDSKAVNTTIKGLQGWIDCFDKAKLSGVIRGIDITEIGDVKQQVKMLNEAYEMGKAI